MSIWQGFNPKPIDIFGGLVTSIDRMDLPENVSPNCQDVEFFVGGVKSRRGAAFLGGPYAGAQSVTAMVRGWQPILGPYTACYFSAVLGGTGLNDGQIFFVDIAGTSLISSLSGLCTYGMGGGAQYGRQYMTFWHPASTAYASGITPPRAYDYNASTAFYRVGLPRPYWADASIAEVASTGNTMTAGTHLFRVTFEGYDGTTSPISGPLSVVATGGINTAIQITNVPTGPPGTVRRVIWGATAVDSAITDTQSYYTLRSSSMVVPDNTTTTVTVAFTDSALTTGEPASLTSLFTLMTPPPAKGVVFYRNRAFWYHLTGAVQPVYQNTLSWWDGLEFSADASAFVGTGLRGWGSIGAGVSTQAGTNGMAKCLRLTADGATATFAILASRALTAPGPVPALTPGKKYGLMFRMRRGATPFTQGSVRVTSNISGYSFNFDTLCTSLGTGWSEYQTGALFANFDYNTAGKSPAFTVEFINTASPNNAYAEIEGFWVYDTANQWQGSLVLGSKPFFPGNCDGINGLMNVSKDDGEQINSAFVLRDNLYFAKNHSLHVTQDNGVTEPSGWSIQRVSDSVGTLSEKGVAVGDNFAVIASRDGLYLFDGGAPQKISQEIQPTWNRIRQAIAYTMSVAVDPVNKQIIVNCALDNDASPLRQLVLDYVEGFGDPLLNGGHGRKWTIWNVPSASVAFADGGFTGQYKTLFGDGSDLGQLFALSSSAHSDIVSLPINAFYETSPQGVQEGVTRFGGNLFWAGGSGTFALSYTRPNNVNTAITTFTLADPAPRNWQQGLNLAAEKLGFRFGTNSAGDYWSLNRFTTFMRPDAYFNIRGLNP